MLRGHFNYFGITGNGDALRRVHHETRRIWGRSLARRNGRRFTWAQFAPSNASRSLARVPPEASSRANLRPESRMREICKSGSVGAPGGRPPGATRRLYSQGGNRNARFHNAMGSARETMACLHVSVAAAYLKQAEVDADLERVDHIIGALWKLSRKQSR